MYEVSPAIINEQRLMVEAIWENNHEKAFQALLLVRQSSPNWLLSLPGRCLKKCGNGKRN